MLSLRSTRAEPHPCHAPHHTHHTHHTHGRRAASLAALRAAIQQFVEANPSFQSELYQAQATQAREPEVVQSATPSEIAFSSLEIATVTGMPMDTPVVTAVTAERVAEGGASAPAGPVVVLTEEDAVAAAAFAVADWSQLRRKPQAAAASKKSIFGGGGGGGRTLPVEAVDGLDPADLAVRASVSGYGGAALQVALSSERGLLV